MTLTLFLVIVSFATVTIGLVAAVVELITSIHNSRQQKR